MAADPGGQREQPVASAFECCVRPRLCAAPPGPRDMGSVCVLALLACGALGAAPPLTVGYLANIRGRQRQGHVISGAMSYAVERVNGGGVLPDNRTLHFVYRDTRGETLPGTRAVIDLWQEGVVALFGPENSCAAEATVAAALDLPLVSYKCADSADKDISTKEYRHHFARTYPPITKVVSSVLALLRYYKWYQFSVVYEQSELYETLARTLEREAGAPFRLLHRRPFPNTRQCCSALRSCCHDPFAQIVRDTEHGTRIYVYMGDKTDLGKLLSVLHMRGLLATGLYMVVYADVESYAEKDAHKYFRLHERGFETVMASTRSLLVVVPTPPRGPGYLEFQAKVNEYNSEPPFEFRADDLFPEWVAHVTPYAAYLYDAVMLYADALAKALRNGTDPREGREVMRFFRQRDQYVSVTGVMMRINEDGDVEGNYTVLSWQPTPASLPLKLPKGQPRPPYCMLPVGQFHRLRDEAGVLQLRFRLEKEILWVNRDQPPLDEPPCGFDGEECVETPDNNKEFAAGVLASLLFISFFGIYMVYKNWKYEQEIDGLLWKLDLNEIRFGQGGAGVAHSASKMSLASHVSMESKIVEQIFTHTAMLRGTVVAVKQLCFPRKSVDVSRPTMKEMKLMREMHNDNINQFIGASINPDCVYIVTEYCSKGSLQDILENDDMKLDSMFIASLVSDLLKGLSFLHESELRFHGNLKSSNCVVSSRWVLQVTDFGLHELRAQAHDHHERLRGQELLWTAPELLRQTATPPFGSQKADVYAFGIILHEIIARQGPFGCTELAPAEIVSRVRSGTSFRPPTAELQCQDYVVQAMREAWHERPECRPGLQQLKGRLRGMRNGMKRNIMDHMMAMMEKYAYNLEELVDERTALLVEEKKKTEALLHRMLPKSVANQLMRGEAVIPESFDAVTVYFSDIVGFTAMSASSTPMQVVTFLNDLYTVFDDIIGHYDVYKVETIGDAYMVVSGLPLRNGESHAGEIAFMALELLASVRAFRVRHRPQLALELRIGVHTGPVAAGVVGLTMPRYCLFGDTVNTASRMESTGEALKIHISPECKDCLDRLGGFCTTERGLVNMKGKGEINTYWLVGHQSGPAKRQGGDPPPPQPLFALHREERLPRRSPKIGDGLGRRGSLAARRGSCVLPVDEPPPSPRLRSPKQRFLRPQWRPGATSCDELAQAAPERRPKLESIHSEECDRCPPGRCSCGGTPGRNGLVHVDESLRPLLSVAPKSAALLRPPEAPRASKKWRSCDEIALPGGTPLRGFLAGLLGGREGPPAREESLV